MPTVLGATDARAPVGFAGLAIGLVLALIHRVGIPVTNTSVSPARSLGPAVFTGGRVLSQPWLCFVAPLLGGATAAAEHRTVFRPVVPMTAAMAERARAGRRAADRGEARTPREPARRPSGPAWVE